MTPAERYHRHRDCPAYRRRRATCRRGRNHRRSNGPPRRERDHRRRPTGHRLYGRHNRRSDHRRAPVPAGAGSARPPHVSSLAPRTSAESRHARMWSRSPPQERHHRRSDHRQKPRPPWRHHRHDHRSRTTYRRCQQPSRRAPPHHRPRRGAASRPIARRRHRDAGRMPTIAAAGRDQCGGRLVPWVETAATSSGPDIALLWQQRLVERALPQQPVHDRAIDRRNRRAASRNPGFARVAPNPLQPANARHRQSRTLRRSKDKL